MLLWTSKQTNKQSYSPLRAPQRLLSLTSKPAMASSMPLTLFFRFLVVLYSSQWFTKRASKRLIKHLSNDVSIRQCYLQQRVVKAENRQVKIPVTSNSPWQNGNAQFVSTLGASTASGLNERCTYKARHIESTLGTGSKKHWIHIRGNMRILIILDLISKTLYQLVDFSRTRWYLTQNQKLRQGQLLPCGWLLPPGAASS